MEKIGIVGENILGEDAKIETDKKILSRKIAVENSSWKDMKNW